MNAEVIHMTRDNSNARAKALTAAGGEFALEKSLRDIVCYLDDGTLLVSKSQAFNPHVRGFITRLMRLGHNPQVMHVELAAIERAYDDSQSESRSESHSATDMQRAAKNLFERAVELRASDIHIRVSSRERTKILVRVHNDLEFIEEHSYEYGNLLCSTIYQAMTSVSDATYEPLSRQDARIANREKLPKTLDGIRVATSPQVDGSLMVLRLLYNDTANSFDLNELGYSINQVLAVNLLKRRPNGIIIVGGPTGSGKSTTQQRILGSIIQESHGRKHVITVEDPPEYPIPGAVQTPVANAETEAERSRAFQAAIKAAMRLDPDIIMIGEVRDTPSAELAVQAAMTGHQVWGTVHANSALAILDRFINLGVPLELVCDPTIFTGLICQRLVKVLCPKCKIPLEPNIQRFSEAEQRRILSAVRLDKVNIMGDGCPHCQDRGTVARTVVSETVITDERLMTFWRNHDRIGAITYWRKEQGGKTMLEHTIDKINEGLVDPFLAESVVGPLNMGLIEEDFRIEVREIADAT